MNAHTQPIERHVLLEGAYNMRDLGGYTTADGRVTQWGRIYRADGLHKLTAQDQQIIVDRGVRTLVDLRHAQELEKMPNVFKASTALAYHNVDMINPAAISRPSVRSLGHLYVGLLDDSQAEIRRVLTLLADEQAAVLYHCAAGKDRTGVISALLLDLVGVSHEDIMNDYELTDDYRAPIMEELRQGRPEAVPVEMYEQFLGCDRAHMAMMLKHLNETYGNAERYLLEIGLTQLQLDALKHKLLGE